MKRALGKMVVGNILANAAMRHPDAPAFYCSSTSRRFTFRETNERTNRLAQALMSLGLKRGDVVAFLLSNRAEIVETFFALARTGIIGLPLNYRLAASEMVELVHAMGATALIYEGRFSAEARQVHQEVSGLKHVIGIGSERTQLDLDYEELLMAASPRMPEIDIDEDDPYYFNLTSGTTGLPKSYMLTHYNNCVAGFVFPSFDMTKRDVVMTVFPIFGRVGFAWVVGSVLYGVPNLLVNFEPSDVLRLIAAEGATIVNLVPTMAAMLLPAQTSAPRDLSSLRAIVFAGAVLPASVREQTSAMLCHDIYEYYGMNEMGALVVSSPADRMKRSGSVGRPIPFSEVRIVGEDGQDVGPNALGEILGRSPMSVTAYFDSPEKSAVTFRDGWLHTGDLGFFDDEGYLYIRGRKKDMIVTGGQNVYAAEVEDVILRCPGVAECAVFGLPDDLWGERVTSVVVLEGSEGLTAAKLDAFCRPHLAGFKIPKEFILDTEALPRTSNGKVQKFLLVERLNRKPA
jgi:fatty-acyl-CoA synthase